MSAALAAQSPGIVSAGKKRGFCRLREWWGACGALAAEPGLRLSGGVLFQSLIRRRLDPTRIIVRRAIERGELPAITDLELAVEAVTAAAVMRVYFLPTDSSVKAMRRLFVVQLRGLPARSY